MHTGAVSAADPRERLKGGSFSRTVCPFLLDSTLHA